MKELVQRLTKVAQRALWGDNVTWNALLRICVWTAFFFVLIGAGFSNRGNISKLIPYYKQLEGTAVRPMAMAKSDSRGFRNSRASVSKKALYAAWIGGSSLHVRDQKDTKTNKWRHETFIPLEVHALMAPKLDREIHFDLYIQSAQRLFDQYLCLLDAIDNKPDLLIVSLNPVWMLNEKAPTLWTNLYPATISGGKADIEDMALMLLFGGPKVLVEGAMASISPLVRNRQDYKIEPTDAISPLLGLESKAKSEKPDNLARVLGMNQPIQFWALFEKMGGSMGGVLDWQRAAMSYVDTEGNSINHKILEKIFDHVERSRVPTIVYMDPVAPWVLEDLVLREALVANEQALEKLEKKYNNKRIRVMSANPTRWLPGLDFRDMVHLRNSEQLSNFIAEEVEKLMRPSEK